MSPFSTSKFTKTLQNDKTLIKFIGCNKYVIVLTNIK